MAQNMIGDSASDLKINPAEARKLAEIYNTVATIPDQKIRDTFPDQYKQLTSNNYGDAAAVGMLRYQLVTLFVQAWVNDYMQSYAQRLGTAIFMGTLKIISSLIAVLVRHDRRLDDLEDWRIFVIAGLNRIQNLINRVASLESKPVFAEQGPTLTVRTVGAVAAELARYKPDPNVAGAQQRKFRVKGVSTDGLAFYIDELTLTASVASGVATLNSLDHVGQFSTGSTVAQAVAGGTDVVITPTGEAGKTIDWTIYEKRTDERKDPMAAPIFRPAGA